MLLPWQHFRPASKTEKSEESYGKTRQIRTCSRTAHNVLSLLKFVLYCLCNGMVVVNRTTSAPKSVLCYILDKGHVYLYIQQRDDPRDLFILDDRITLA